ncbi:MAG: protein kinase domain-containing protein [Gemmatimonadaceae bacterium]
MLPSEWRELEPLIDRILDAPAAEREKLAWELSGPDQARFEALMEMTSECESAAPFLSRPAGERFARLFDEPEKPMPEALGSYRIEREIGRGGMARVYLARDGKHSRHVAVKVIRSELAASLGRERFLREIAIAARLRHPNILPLFDSGDQDGILYFVMPLEEGPSLRQCLESASSFSVSERLGILRDIARALAYAHARGVVHRDIKPDNVMLSSGAAVVTDFGIATAVSAAQAGAPGVAPGPADFGAGTPEYMAPEQARGDPKTDHRADIFSFGGVARELFADTAAPKAVSALIARCLQEDPAARPQTAQEILAELERSQDSARGVVPVALRYRVAAGAAVAAGLLALVAIAYTSTPRGATDAAGDRTVAVLPLVSVGGDSMQQELADGLSDEVATELFKVDGVRVVSRRGVRNYRRKRDLDPKAAGRTLGARFLVMGTLREVDGRLVVLSQLLDARTGALLWSDRFDRSQFDLGPVRDEIVRSVGDTIRRIAGLSVAAAKPPEAKGRSSNADAYRLYILAQNALYRRGLSIQSSVDMFRRATQVDTMYASAYSGLSMALALSPHFGPTAPDQVATEAAAMAERAIRLDSTLAQPHIALGVVHQNGYDWARAGAEFRKAISLDPRDVEARVQYGRHLLFRGRLDDALRQFLSARSEDPASALVSSWVSYSYYVRGAMDSAVVESNRAFQSDSNNTTTLVLGALVRLKAGRSAEARQFVLRGPPANESVFYVLAAIGDTAEAMKRLRAFENTSPRRWRAETNRAYAMLGAGDTEKALDAFERATDAREIWPSLHSTHDPIFDPIRENPRFQKLLRRVGL